VSDAGETPASGVPTAAPVPAKLAACGLPVALSETDKVPVLVPDAVGLNLTLIVQFALAARELPQLLVCEKSPFAVMLEIVRAALPVLDKVIVCDALVVPTF